MRFRRHHYNIGSGHVYITNDEQKNSRKTLHRTKKPEQALEFAIAFEEGIKRQKCYERKMQINQKRLWKANRDLQ